MGEFLVLDNLYPSNYRSPACEGIIEFAWADQDETSPTYQQNLPIQLVFVQGDATIVKVDNNDIVSFDVVVIEGFDKWGVIQIWDRDVDYYVLAILDMEHGTLRGMAGSNSIISYTIIDKVIYFEYGFINLAGASVVTDLSVSTTTIATIPNVAGISGRIPTWRENYFAPIPSGDSGIRQPQMRFSNGGDGNADMYFWLSGNANRITPLGNGDVSLFDLENNGFRMFQPSTRTDTTLADDTTDPVTPAITTTRRVIAPRDTFQVSYVFQFVRHDKSNDDLFYQLPDDTTRYPKASNIFYTPVVNGVVNSGVNETNTSSIIRGNLGQPQTDNSNVMNVVTSVSTSGNNTQSIIFDQTTTILPTDIESYVAFFQPQFTINLGSQNAGWQDFTHIRVWRTDETVVGAVGTLYFLTDMPAISGSSWTLDANGIPISQTPTSSIGTFTFLDEVTQNDTTWSGTTVVNGSNQFGADMGYIGTQSQIPNGTRFAKTFVSSGVLVGGEDNTLGLFNTVDMLVAPNRIIGNAFSRLLMLSPDKRTLMWSMFMGQDGTQVSSNSQGIPYMLKHAANNWQRFEEPIQAVFAFNTRLFVFTRVATYMLPNANQHTRDGTIPFATQQLSTNIGTIYPNSVMEFGGSIWFINSEGYISEIRGTEVIRSDIGIKRFTYLGYELENGEQTIDTLGVKELTRKDMKIFFETNNQDQLNFELFCTIYRPTEPYIGTFTYSRYYDRGGDYFRRGWRYGDNRYGRGFYGGLDNTVDGHKCNFASGIDTYSIGFSTYGRHSLSGADMRLFKIFNIGCYYDLVSEDDDYGTPTPVTGGTNG